MILFITRSTLDHFPRLVPALQRTLDETSLGESWSIQALLDHLVNFEAYAFFDEDTETAGAFTISVTPLKRSIYCFWLGKAKGNDKPIDYAEMDKFFIAAAQHFNCTQLLFEGRKGWEKIGAPLGYTEDTRTYSKEVSYELSEIQPVAAHGGQSSGS